MTTRPPRLVTYKDAAAQLSISVPQVKRAIARGDLTPVQAPCTTGNVGMRVTQRSIDRLLKDRIEKAERLAARKRLHRSLGQYPELA